MALYSSLYLAGVCQLWSIFIVLHIHECLSFKNFVQPIHAFFHLEILQLSKTVFIVNDIHLINHYAWLHHKKLSKHCLSFCLRWLRVLLLQPFYTTVWLVSSPKKYLHLKICRQSKKQSKTYLLVLYRFPCVGTLLSSRGTSTVVVFFIFMLEGSFSHTSPVVCSPITTQRPDSRASLASFTIAGTFILILQNKRDNSVKYYHQFWRDHQNVPKYFFYWHQFKKHRKIKRSKATIIKLYYQIALRRDWNMDRKWLQNHLNWQNPGAQEIRTLPQLKQAMHRESWS